MTESLVSVVIPVYNVERFLRPCVDSVLGQTFQCLEIILVNDGSTDGSPAICDEYAAADPRIRVIHQENRGLSCARNRGLDVAQGEYVYFLDSDDRITENAIQKLLNRAESENLEVLLFEGGVIDEDGERVPSARVRAGTYDKGGSGRTLFAELKRDRDYRANVQLLFIRQRFLQKIGLVFYEGILHEDEPFTFLLLMQCAHCGYLPERLLYKRRRAGSIMRTPQTEKNVEGCLCGLEEMARYYAANQFDPQVAGEIRGHIAYAFWNTYTRFQNLNATRRKQNKDLKKRLFDCIGSLQFLGDDQIAKRFRFDWVYDMSSTLATWAGRVRRRIGFSARS